MCQSQYSDERHALLECSALTHLRDKYQQLFSAHNFHAAVLMAAEKNFGQYDLSLNA